MPIVDAVQITPAGQPVLACLRQQPHTTEEVAVFAAAHIAPSANVVSVGLWCFRATTIVGAEQERVVTGGGKASVKLPQFKAVNTLLRNLKTAIGGTYHAFDFVKYAHRYHAEFQYRFNRRFNQAHHARALASRPGRHPDTSPSIGFGLLRLIANQEGV